MTVHAMEEMAEDDLDIIDIEQAIFTGQVVRRVKDARGPKYLLEGLATDSETRVGVVGRFISSERYLILTVYEVGREQ